MAAPARHFRLRDAAPRWWFVMAALVGLFAFRYVGAERDRELREPVRLSGLTMGTTYNVVLPGAAPRGAADLRAEVERVLAEVEASMSTYDAQSELSRFNAHTSTEPFVVSAALAEVLRAALEVSRASGGAFDVTVGPLVEAWGFGAGGRPLRVPGEAELSVLRERVGYAKLTLKGNAFEKAHPELRVDLSGIAKGYAVDRIAELLEVRGHDRYLVEVGGELRVRGERAPSEPFRVGIESPTTAGRRVYALLSLSRGALATSGDYRIFHEHDGRRYGHTLDPRTGAPVRHELRSATVFHERCMLADAWATALMVLGPEAAREVAQGEKLEVLLLSAGEGEALREHITPGLAARRARSRQ